MSHEGEGEIDDLKEVVDISMLATAQLNTIGDLLHALQLPQLESLFVREEIDLKTILYVTDAHLTKLGLSMSERIKLLRCTQILKDIPINPRFMPKQQAARQPKPVIPPPQPPTVTITPPPRVIPVVVPPTPTAAATAQLPPPRRITSLPRPAVTPKVPILESTSLAFIVYDLASNSCLKHAKLMEKSFTRDLKVDRVSLFGYSAGEEESTAAEEMFRFLNICSNSNDDLLWFVLLGSTPGINTVVQPMVNVIFDTFAGKNVFFVLDSVQSTFAEELAFPSMARNALGFSLLTSSYPQSPNPLYLSLNLLDTMRSNVPLLYDILTEYSVERFVDECFANLEFLERCSETLIQVNYLPGQEEDVLQSLPILLSVDATQHGIYQDRVGMRGICKDRPVCVIQAKRDMLMVRFLEEYSDPQYVQLDDIMFDYEEEDEGVQQLGDSSLLQDDFFENFDEQEWLDNEEQQL